MLNRIGGQGSSNIAHHIFRHESASSSDGSSSNESSQTSNVTASFNITAKPTSPVPPRPSMAAANSGDDDDNHDAAVANVNAGFRKSMEDILYLFRRRSTGSASGGGVTGRSGERKSVAAGSTTSSGASSSTLSSSQQPQRLPTKAVDEWRLHEFLERRFGPDHFRVEMRGDRYEIFAPRRVRCVGGHLDLDDSDHGTGGGRRR